MIQFAHPMYLSLGGAAVIVLALMLARAARKRREAVRRLSAASPQTSLAPRRRLLRDVLAVLGVAFAFVALARPLGGYRLEAAPTRGVDLMFAVDTSKSMRAADIRPDRLTRAKLAVTDLARSLDTARLGLIAFAGDAFVQAPMTADRGVFLDAVDALDTDVIPRGGTDVSSAIHAAEEAMASEPDHHKVLVLLSDGEDLAGTAVAAARDAAAHGLTIYTVGVGSEEGSLIELADAAGHKNLVRDEAGQPVRSHLDERTLRAIAQVTGGAYAPLGASGHGLDQLLAQARAHLPATTAAGTQRRVYAERFQTPLGLALACLLVELVIGDRRRRRRVAAPAPARPKAARLGLAALVVALAAPAVASAAPVTEYNAGTSAYRKGDFTAAEKQFESALHSGDVALQADAYYDLGNARYRQGESTVAKDRAATIATWKRALEAYDAALALAPKDADARFNRDFVGKKLAALEEEQKKQEEQQKQQGGQGQQQQKQQGGQGQQQQKQQGGQGQQQQQQQGGQGQQQQQQQGGQGQQQNQNGQQGHQQNQSGQQGQQQNQKGQGQQNQNGQQGDPQKQNGQQGDPQKQNGQQGQPSDKNGQPSDKNGQQGQHDKQGQADAPDAAMGSDHAPQGSIGAVGQGSANGSAETAAEARADGARRAAGQLTHGEAVQLLDSVAHDLKPMPIRGRTSGHPTHTTTKDW